ncbi:hypothetical protein T439DRAFT_28412 [Meredithblackwellia eburnea MCA 4105]
MFSFAAIATFGLATALQVSAIGVVPAPNAPVTVSLNGVDYTWQSTVAYGEISPNLQDKFGDVIGGIGSAATVKKFKVNPDGTYSGTLVVQPDRGHNTVSLENYAGRRHYFDFTLAPCTTATCNAAGNPSISLTYVDSLQYKDNSPLNQNGGLTSGLDATAIRPASGLFPQPLPQTSNGALAFDAEGIALLADGSSFVSDEYGPSIYHVDASGNILSALPIPQSILPHLADGTLSFQTVGSTPTYGRVPNQGFEGLSVSADNTRLFALVQSALEQDQLVSASNRQYTRLLTYDITNPDAGKLIAEYVVQLPESDASTVFAQSELLYVSDNVFLVLARDGKGNGNGNSPSSTASTSQLTANYKNAGLITLVGATNILGSFDNYADSIAPAGVLNPAITPAAFHEFVNIIDPTQLAKFGLHNGKPVLNDIVGKWESLALQPVLDPAFPNDYFLFALADNDFISTTEWVAGVDTGPDPYATNVPNGVLVFRVTLPGAKVPTYLQAQSVREDPWQRSLH